MLRFVEKGRLDTVVNFHNIVVLDCCTQNLIIRFFIAALEKLIRCQIGMSFIAAASASSKTPRSTSNGESAGATADARLMALSISARLIVTFK